MYSVDNDMTTCDDDDDDMTIYDYHNYIHHCSYK